MANYKRGYAATRRRRPGRGSEAAKRARMGQKPVRKELGVHWWEIDDANGVPNYLQWWWLGNWPKYWDVLYHSRPKRRANRRLEHQVLRGADPDAIAWPLGNHRPHKYYW